MQSAADLKPGKLHYGDLDLLDAKQRLEIRSIDGTGRAPSGIISIPDAFQRAKVRVDSKGRGVGLMFSGADLKQVRAWANSGAKLEAMDDGLDKPSVASRKREGMSIAGIRPKHLAFNPFPQSATANTGLKEALDKLLEEGVVTLDSRNPWMTAYPWSACGQVFRQRSSDRQMHAWGSGFMFGSRVMMTARHLFPEDIRTSFDAARYFFAPGYMPQLAASGGAFPFGISEITANRGKRHDSGSFLGNGFWGDPAPWDYAICLLNDRLGDLSGTMGVACFGKSNSYRETSDRYPRPRYYDSAGYPSFNNGWPVQETWAKIRDVDGGPYERELETKNFAGPGWSGGPLFGYLDVFGGTYVVGVCSGLEVMDSLLPPYSQCVWAGGSRMIDLANWAVANWWD